MSQDRKPRPEQLQCREEGKSVVCVDDVQLNCLLSFTGSWIWEISCVIIILSPPSLAVEVPLRGDFQPPKQQTRAAETEMHQNSEGGLTSC